MFLQALRPRRMPRAGPQANQPAPRVSSLAGPAGTGEGRTRFRPHGWQPARVCIRAPRLIRIASLPGRVDSWLALPSKTASSTKRTASRSSSSPARRARQLMKGAPAARLEQEPRGRHRAPRDRLAQVYWDRPVKLGGAGVHRRDAERRHQLIALSVAYGGRHPGSGGGLCAVAARAGQGRP